MKGATDINTSNFAKETALASLKSDVDSLDIDKLETTTVDLSKLSDMVKKAVVKKLVYDELVKKS